MELLHIEVLKMDNGEILSNGHSLGFDKNDKFKTVRRFDAMTGKEIDSKSGFAKDEILEIASGLPYASSQEDAENGIKEIGNLLKKL